ncbi:MAG: diaminopimelate epimerase, partial [Verrucomicrobia bacterium]|nr:diaminopimelate epimerase [Verrucomicrobiota bacterium]
MRFSKYHALGNDYLVLDPADAHDAPSVEAIRLFCHRNFGLGSDGILYGPLVGEKGAFGLRIFNPDGSEAEKSGNGLRIFARYLFDSGKVGTDAFAVDTLGGRVECRVHEGGGMVTVEMGRVVFDAETIPVSGFEGEVVDRELELAGETLRFCAATIGNPHCVFPVDKATAAEVKRIGPVAEIHPAFPNRTNVQLLEVVDRRRIRIEIWERGAGYTLASGSSGSATGAVAKRLGLVDDDIAVEMPGGEIHLRIDDDFNVRMTGPVTRVG